LVGLLENIGEAIRISERSSLMNTSGIVVTKEVAHRYATRLNDGNTGDSMSEIKSVAMECAGGWTVMKYQISIEELRPVLVGRCEIPEDFYENDLKQHP
jgi:hypothetical protein